MQKQDLANPIGQKVVEEASSPGSMKKARGLAGTFFKSTFGLLGDIYIVLFLGIFFTVSPNTYKKGLVALIPKKGKAKGEEVLEKLSDNLKKWLKGKLFSMVVADTSSSLVSGSRPGRSDKFLICPFLFASKSVDIVPAAEGRC
jgi:predicted PurR-regulated permease PerM